MKFLMHHYKRIEQHINALLQECVVPAVWKMSNIISVHKREKEDAHFPCSQYIAPIILIPLLCSGRLRFGLACWGGNLLRGGGGGTPIRTKRIPEQFPSRSTLGFIEFCFLEKAHCDHEIYQISRFKMNLTFFFYQSFFTTIFFFIFVIGMLAFVGFVAGTCIVFRAVSAECVACCRPKSSFFTVFLLVP